MQLKRKCILLALPVLFLGCQKSAPAPSVAKAAAADTVAANWSDTVPQDREANDTARFLAGMPGNAGSHVKILDGNHLASTQHRIKELRTIGAGALPGQALVVLDPSLMLVIDVVLCEDGHAQERSLLGQILPTVRAKDVWIDDRNFCTTGFLFGIAPRGVFRGASTWCDAALGIHG